MNETLALVPVRRPATMHPSMVSPDRYAKIQQRYQLNSGGIEGLLARARRNANRMLPYRASLPCGCHQDDLCAEARRHWDARNEPEFTAHRQMLYPGTRIRMRVRP